MDEQPDPLAILFRCAESGFAEAVEAMDWPAVETLVRAALNIQWRSMEGPRPVPEPASRAWSSDVGDEP